MTYVHGNRRDWSDACINLSCGLQGAMRGDSTRKLRYMDLNISNGYGATKFGPLSRCLLLVLRRGIHKDRHDVEEQIGFWRHKMWPLCSVFNISASVIWSLTHKKFEY